MAEEMQFCIECGEDLPESPTFCPSCGLNIEQVTDSGGATGKGTQHSPEPRQPEQPSSDGSVRESLVSTGEQVSSVALLFMGVSGALFVLSAFVPTWYTQCVESSVYAIDCASQEPIDVEVQWRAWTAFWGGLVLLSGADEYWNLGIFGSWRIKKSKLLLIAGFLGMAPHSELRVTDGEMAIGGAVILAAGSLMLLYAVPTMVWQWLFDKRIGRR
jgi:hypothetical protein